MGDLPTWAYLVAPAALCIAVICIHWREAGDKVDHLANLLDDALDIHDPGDDVADLRDHGAHDRRPS